MPALVLDTGGGEPRFSLVRLAFVVLLSHLAAETPLPGHGVRVPAAAELTSWSCWVDQFWRIVVSAVAGLVPMMTPAALSDLTVIGDCAQGVA